MVFGLTGRSDLANYSFIGSGELLVNGASPTGLALMCPFEIRFKGTVAANDGSENEYKLKAFTTYVIDHSLDTRDPIPGCMEAMTKISIDPTD